MINEQLNRYDLEQHIINFVKQFGLISHNIDSFNQLTAKEGLSTVLGSDFNKEYFIENDIPDSDIKRIRYVFLITNVEI